MKLKKILSHIFIISVALIGFLGLISSPVKSNTPSDVLVVGQIAEPKSLDPATVTAVNDFRILIKLSLFIELIDGKIKENNKIGKYSIMWSKAISLFSEKK